MINVWSEFQPLKELVVGKGYPADYFDHIKDSEVRDNLQTIFNEIEQDFLNLKNTLESFGIRVTRPSIISKQEFQKNPSVLPPLTPRDRQGVFGRRLVRLSNTRTYAGIFEMYGKDHAKQILDAWRDNIEPNVIDGANNTCVYRMGRDIWFDHSEWMTTAQSQWLKQHALQDPRYRFHDMHTAGHGDCVFAVLKPGVLLTSHHHGVAYERDFPGWAIHCVTMPSVMRESWWQFRDGLHPGLIWWVPNQHNLPRFKSYVDQYLADWVGAVHESVFDVNCLSIDENHVIFGCYDAGVFAYCRAHGIEPILCDIRHRFFFDGSVHCCTLDIEREGAMEDYL